MEFKSVKNNNELKLYFKKNYYGKIYKWIIFMS